MGFGGYRLEFINNKWSFIHITFLESELIESKILCKMNCMNCKLIWIQLQMKNVSSLNMNFEFIIDVKL